MTVPPRLSLQALLPLRAAIITLRFMGPATFAPLHGPALTGFLRSLLDDADSYDLYLTVDAPESGHVSYRSGERYRFTLFCLAGGEPLFARLLERLAGLPGTAPRLDAALPFRDNLAFEGACDLFTGRPEAGPDAFSTYTAAALAKEAQWWWQAGPVRLRWLSPARLLLDPEDREGRRGDARYCRDRREVSYPLLAARLHDALADLLRRRGLQPAARGPVPPLPAESMDLFWVDSRYRDAQGAEQTMGGLMGVVELAEGSAHPEETWPLWVLGQYVGIGQRRAFGWGRYRLETADGGGTLRRAEPAAWLLARAAEPENLSQAYGAIRANLRPPLKAIDDEEWLEAIDQLDREARDEEEAAGERLTRLGERLSSGAYHPPALSGVVFTEPDGDLRALAVPPFMDRVAQRALVQVLTPAIEPLLFHGSFGYRQRRSRHGAARAVQQAYAAGYRWVFESDIADFFDTVSWTHLHNRLTALYGDDPAVALMLRWMAAPIDYQGERIERTAGLPQGAPLSPLLANLMLDDFDSDMEAAGFRLVRFADDFVVLCQDREQAECAAQAARSSLEQLGLALSAGKTRITDFNRGFRYLGYLFVNELALDVAGERSEEPAAAPKVPKGWLAQLAKRQPQALAADGSLPHAPELPEPTRCTAEAGEEGAMVFVTGAPALVSTRQGRLDIEREHAVLHSLPLEAIRGLLLIGPHHLTTPAAKAALEARVPVHFATSGGRYQGVLWDGQPGAEGALLWLRQVAYCQNPTSSLAAARSVVTARLRHQREVLRQRDAEGLAHAEREAIEAMVRKAEAVDSAESLNGAEGQGARLYFQALARWLPADWGFSGRTRQPPTDPFNALLSLGYTILYAHVETSIRTAGLFPWVGFYHQARGRHAALASDLLEPFRHLVERTALAMTARGGLVPADFTVDAAQGCRLRDAPRRRYLSALSERFEKPLTALGEEQAKRLHEHLYAQNQRLIASIRDPAVPFRAWCLR